MALKEASATSPSSSCSPYPTKFGCFLEPSETIEKRLKSCRFYWEYAIIILSEKGGVDINHQIGSN
ncbi:Uncharacterized protein TCM_005382 [Theobroma cacao]|uniref:Uncharacterized protein n=1 Tax=Theobroma cacao TaxID=3641 RepID=A0A061DUF6_THECC|nr:Uncharacterized protein TCM_005382 [Theobroma cacao]